MRDFVNTKLYPPEQINFKPFFKKKTLSTTPDYSSHSTFFQASGGKPTVQLQDAPASGPIVNQEQALQSSRFQNDPILDLVMKNLLTLKKGKRGAQIDVAVAKVQRALIDAGFPLTEFGPDGIFGSETETAVKQFQASQNLTESEQDGKVGPVTLGLLDQHFEDRTKTGLIPEDTGTSALEFSTVPPLDPRYTNPDPFVDIQGDALRLNGPAFGFLPCVLTTGDDLKEAKKWEAGHIQDIIDADILGQYNDGHELSFITSLPIRDSVRGQQLFPWYNPDNIRPVKIGQSVCSAMTDDPGVQFPARDENAILQLISMKFKAIDWFVVRNRNTGEIKFLHNAQWGFDLSVAFDPDNMPDMNSEEGKGVVVTNISNFPEPTGKIDSIEHSSGKGSTTPCMTEGVFNEEVRLVKIES